MLKSEVEIAHADESFFLLFRTVHAKAQPSRNMPTPVPVGATVNAEGPFLEIEYRRIVVDLEQPEQQVER
jgi:hypothetical protein